MQQATVLAKVTEMIEPSIDAEGYDLVQLKWIEAGKRPTLQIMAEKKGYGGMLVEDCTKISRMVSVLLDVEDPISGAYNLEVSSPGIDRPLIKPEDFAHYLGHLVSIKTTISLDGRKRFKGILDEIEGNIISVDIDNDRYEIALEAIESAKLVLTDALIAAHQNQKHEMKENIS
jgi:ribosome maturation factor RimP